MTGTWRVCFIVSPSFLDTFAQVTDGIHAYGVASHRHSPEIEEGLTAAAGKEVRVCLYILAN